MADYSINYSEVGKQHTSLTEQLGALSKVLDDLTGVQESMLSAAQWSAEDKKEFTDRFTSFLDAGRKLYESGTKEADALQQISDAYKNAEQG